MYRTHIHTEKGKETKVNDKEKRVTFRLAKNNEVKKRWATGTTEIFIRFDTKGPETKNVCFLYFVKEMLEKKHFRFLL